MELQTVSRVSKSFGISAQMLRYYERSGLIKSLRKDDYAYRVYDEKNIERLQQIIILRKLQIHVKQICIILNNPDAATAIDIFKANISELQNEIASLSTIKSALEIFVSKIEELAAVRLNLNLLTDESVMKLAESLSLTQRNVKENMNMDELNKAADVLKKKSDNVRIVYRPPATIASIQYNGGDSASDIKAKKDSEAVMEKFIKDTDLFKLKPDMRVFGFGTGGDNGGWEMWATIPDDLNVPAPLTKITHNGGLYATSPAGFDLWQWIQDSELYDWYPHGPGGDEYINPFNIYGLKNNESEINGCMYTEFSIPIKEIENYTEDQINEVNAKLAEMEKGNSFETVEIDMAAMIQKGEFDLKFFDGLMEMKAGKGYDAAMMVTPREFSPPLKIELRAKTNATDINIDYTKGWISYNHFNARDKWFVMDFITGDVNSYKLRKPSVINEFVNIEWIIGKEIMVIKLNGEIQHFGTDYAYIQVFKENPEFNISSAFTIVTCNNSTLTVESLRVTEFK